MPAQFIDEQMRVRSQWRARLLIGVGILILGFCGVCLHSLVDSHQAAARRAAETAQSLVEAIASDVSRNIETLDLSLQAVVDNLKYPGVEGMDPALRQLILFDRSATARHLGAMLVIDETGELRLDSRTLHPQTLNVADRDYFQAHKNDAGITTFIGRPQRAKMTGEWFIGLSRRLSHSDGSFAGVVMGSLRLSYFERLFKATALGLTGNVTLIRSDGTIIMRWPYQEKYIGLKPDNAALLKRLPDAPSGIFEMDSSTDGVRRVVAYKKIGELPLVVGVGQTSAQIYSDWRRSALSTGGIVAVLCVLTIVLAVGLSRELKRRELAERHLAVLASSDGLTNLFNHRCFEEALHQEWGRCLRMRRSLTLLMIDVDDLKPYNDSHGHQAGDLLLRTVGKAIAETLRDTKGCGARYGGDEFAALLPEATAAEAEAFAEALRQRFSQECAANGVTGPGLSIGISSANPRPGDSPDALVRRADEALYRAKERGRGRTERLHPPQVPRAA